jgi:type II secretory pathway component GspD/PulD (secretin)
MRIGAEAALFVQPGSVDSGKQPVATEGLTLSITCQISADGIVHMSMSPTWTERRRDHGVANDRERAASVVELDTTMRVRDGETVVISGLLRETSERVSAGGLSGIFGATRQKAGRTELIILLTPTIVTPSSPAAGAQ